MRARAAWRALLDDLVRRGLRTPELVVVDGAPGLEKGAGGAVAGHGCPTLHRAQASQPPRSCARAPARGNLERLPRHDLRRDARRGRDPAQSVEPQWRLKCRAVADSLEEAGPQAVHIHAVPARSQWKSIRTSNAIERLHEEFKRRINTQTVLPCAETAAMLFWALLALRTDHHAQGRRMADPRRETRRSDH